MKKNKTTIFITIASVALLSVLIIQVNWIFQTAKIKEELFNEKANIVLARTAEALSADTQTCKKMEECVGSNEIQKIDSLFTHFMNFYNFHIDYSFEVLNPNGSELAKETELANNVYKKRLDEVVSKSGLELNFILPEKTQFIIAEMGPLFITSIVLILIVLILFWRTISSLLKEKKIAEHTTDFLNNMTHEFKTPLTNIALASKMILKDIPAESETKTRHYSGIIFQENEKLRLQVEQMLNMTALERDEIPIQKASINFHHLIQDVAKNIGIQIENKKGHLHLNLDAEKHFIMGDKIHLANMLCNLIDNAIKYSLQQLDIAIKTVNRDNQLIIQFSDKGIGIDKTYQKEVFTKFFRVPSGNLHDVKGFGLGLAYTKKIIELHQGTIELQSEKRNGTTFTITLPYA